MTAYINGVQQVSITIANGATSGTATITAAVGTAFIIFQGSTFTQAGVSSTKSRVRVELTNSTTVTAYRNATDTSTCTVNAVVVDATSSLVTSVQTGTISLSAGVASNTATISSVNTSNTAIVNLGSTASPTTLGLNSSSAVLSLTNATTVTAKVNGAGGVPTIGYCVIEFQGAVLNQAVQGFTDTAAPSTTTRTHTITSVDVNNTMCFFAGMYSSGTSAATGYQDGTLTNATTFTINTSANPFITLNYGVFVVEFVPGVLAQNAQRGEISIAAGTSGTATITSVNTANAIANYLGNTTSGTNFNTIHGDVALTNATTVTGAFNTSTTGKISWEAVEFTVGVAPFVNWKGSYEETVNPAPKAVQNTFIAQIVQPSPINQTDWYAFYQPEVKPFKLSAQFTYAAQKILPSPITQNVYAVYDPQVKAPPLAARFSVSPNKIQPSPISQNNYPLYDASVKPAPLRVSSITQPIPLIIAPVTVNNFYPTYEAKVTPPLLNSRFSYFAEQLAAPLVIINWTPIYNKEVKPVPLAAKFSSTAQLIPTPITLNNWYSFYRANVLPAPLNSQSLVVAPVPTIPSTLSPNNWYPAYPAELSKPAIAQCGTVTQMFQLITPTPIPNQGGHFIPDKHGKRTLSNVLVVYDKAKKLPRKQTKELRDAISEFVPASVANQAKLPDIAKVDYQALAANDAAYERFAAALENIQKQLEIVENERIKKTLEDDELLLITVIACSIY